MAESTDQQLKALLHAICTRGLEDFKDFAPSGGQATGNLSPPASAIV